MVRSFAVTSLLACLLFAQSPVHVVRRATELLAAGDLASAETLARSALADPATKAVAHAVLGSIRLQQRKYAESVSMLNAALKLEPHLTGARSNLGYAYLLQGKSVAAQTAFNQVLAQDPANASARQGLAKAQAQGRAWQAALKTIHPLTDELSRTSEGLILLATIYAGARRSDAAARLAEPWQNLGAGSLEATTDFARLLVDAGAYREALQLLTNAPTTYSAAVIAAEASLKLKDIEKAERYYSRALDLEPQSIAIHLKVAGISEARGDLEKSLSHLIAARKLDPRNADAQLAFGRVCLRMDLADDAEQALETAVALRPDHTESIYVLASARVAKRRFPEAQALIEKLVARAPRDSRLRYSLGSVLYLGGLLIEAEQQFRESIRLDPTQIASHYYLGVIAQNRGSNAEAIRILKGVVEKDPQHAPAWETLGAALARQGSFDEAKNAFCRAIELNPKSVRANYQYALLLSRMGNKEEATKQTAVANDLRRREKEQSRVRFRLYDPEERQPAPERP